MKIREKEFVYVFGIYDIKKLESWKTFFYRQNFHRASFKGKVTFSENLKYSGVFCLFSQLNVITRLVLCFNDTFSCNKCFRIKRQIIIFYILSCTFSLKSRTDYFYGLDTLISLCIHLHFYYFAILVIVMIQSIDFFLRTIGFLKFLKKSNPNLA